MAGLGLLQPALPPPRGVQFYATERELIEVYLRPRVMDVNFVDLRCVIETIDNIFQSHPEDIVHHLQVYYRPNQYYYFTTRILLARNRPNRAILNHTDQWAFVSTKKIYQGLLLIGYVETVELKTQEGLSTGWTVREYRIAVNPNVFQTRVLVHMEYDITKDERFQQVLLGGVDQDWLFELLDEDVEVAGGHV